MKNLLPKKIVYLADKLDFPIYVVGGACRDFLIDNNLSKDLDFSAPIKVENLAPILLDNGFIIKRQDELLGYIKFSDGEREYEYTSFRVDKYSEGGKHKPLSLEFTSDIILDAKRRDFKCNAVYYDIKNGEFVDPLGGIIDIKNKVLSTTREPELILSFDGERLLRLARFAGELGFTIERETGKTAKKYAKNVADLSKARVYRELDKILHADSAHEFSPKDGHYIALKVLDNLGVLDYVLKELTLGRDMAQRSDFHNYDVLNHTLKSVLYSDSKNRFTMLLHDIGKPYAMINFNNYYNHSKYGEIIARRIMEEFCISKKEQERVCFLIYNHMIDLDGKMSENKIISFIKENKKYIEDLYRVKLADYKGCKDGKESVTPFEIKWRKIAKKIELDNNTTNNEGTN